MADLHREFLRLSRDGKWEEMGRLVTDDVLNTFCAVGNAKQVAKILHERFGGIFNLISTYSGDGPGITPIGVLNEMKALG